MNVLGDLCKQSGHLQKGRKLKYNMCRNKNLSVFPVKSIPTAAPALFSLGPTRLLSGVSGAFSARGRKRGKGGGHHGLTRQFDTLHNVIVPIFAFPKERMKGK
jgi:hypothetical protein